MRFSATNHSASAVTAATTPVLGDKLPLSWIFLGSLLISAWVLLNNPQLLNQDVNYLLASQALLAEGWESTVSQYPRSGLPLLIAALQTLTGVSTLSASMFLHAALYAGFACSFMLVIRAMGGNQSVQLWAFAVLLLHPLWLEHRNLVPREFGFWSCVLLSILSMHSYCRQPNWEVLLQWAGLVMLGMLFRNEAIFLLWSTPLAVYLALPIRQRNAAAVRLAAVAALLFFTVIYSGLWDWLRSPVGGLFQHTQPAWYDIGHSLLQTDSLAQEALTEQQQRWANSGALLALLFSKLVGGLGWLSLLLLGWGLWRGAYVPFNTPSTGFISKIICTQLVFCMAGLLLLLPASQQFSIVDLGTVVVGLLLFLPFALNDLWSHSKRLQRGLFAMLLLLLFLPGLRSPLPNAADSEEAYLEETRSWLQQHATADAVLYTNLNQLAWASKMEVRYKPKRSGLELLNEFGHASYPQFLVLRLSMSDAFSLYPLRAYPQIQWVAQYQLLPDEWLVVLQNSDISISEP
jgi:hypothetical protein